MGQKGFEPLTSRVSDEGSNQLSYSPLSRITPNLRQQLRTLSGRNLPVPNSVNDNLTIRPEFEPHKGFEPLTIALQERCSAN